MSLDTDLKRAKKLEKSGQIDQARMIYQATLSKFPNNKRVQAALANLPSNAPAHSADHQLLALVQACKANKHHQVLAKANQLENNYTSSALFWLTRGISFQATGQSEHAVQCFQKVLEIDPQHPQANTILAKLHLQQKRFDKAIQYYQNVVQYDPDNVSALVEYATALVHENDDDTAIEALQRVITISPRDYRAHSILGFAFSRKNQTLDALAHFQIAATIRPSDVHSYKNIATLSLDLGRHRAAIKSFIKAAELVTDDLQRAKYFASIARIHKYLGEFDHALEYFDHAISIAPKLAHLHRSRCAIQPYETNHPIVGSIIKWVSDEATSEYDRASYAHALSDVYVKAQNFEQGFEYLAIANRSKLTDRDYDFASENEMFKRVKAKVDEVKELSEPKKVGQDGPTPIFILGMPRSGTTLLEQIISSHRNVIGGGELPHACKLGLPILTSETAITRNMVSEFRENYLQLLGSELAGARLFTDKTPQNFLVLPLIRAAFPEAKIVHCVRKPQAVCWSNFSKNLNGDLLQYSFDLKNTVDYYFLYHDLMTFVEADYGHVIHHQNYEALVEDQEGQTRQLIEYLGLPWDDACLEPHKNKRAVRTASTMQVREKVYKGSSEQWRNYEPHLDGVFDRFDGFDWFKFKSETV